MNRRYLRGVIVSRYGMGRAAVLLFMFLISSACSCCAGMTTNIAETSPTHEDAALRTRVYDRPIGEVRAMARGIVADFDRWQLMEEKACCAGGVQVPFARWPMWDDGAVPDTKGALAVEITTLVFRFVDDMNIYLEPMEGNRTRVNVRSASRVGKGDLGVNARNIAKFLKELDTRVATGEKVSKGTP